MSLLQGKRAIILGVANERSIAWGIAKEYYKQGAKLVLTYLNDSLKRRIECLISESNMEVEMLLPFDASIDSHYGELYQNIRQKWDNIDIVVHSLAFARKEDLAVPFHETSKEGFQLALNISSYSLIALANSLLPLLKENSSIISMTYHGSQFVLPTYKVMGVAKAALETSTKYLASDLGPKGIRVNCISSGPIRTLAASAVGSISKMLKVIEERAPLRRNVTPIDIGHTALYLGSDLSSAVTGQILYVDSGVSIQAMDEFSQLQDS